MTHTATQLRRTAGAGVAIGALVASALMFAPAAQAATEVTVTNAEVKPTAADYTAWHQGYDKNPTGAKVTTSGLELSGGPSQVIKGYTDNSQTLNGNRNFDLTNEITGARFTASEGVSNLQVPLFYDDNGTTRFTTLRSAVDAGSQVKLTDEWASSRAVGDIPASTPTPLRQIIAALGTNYKVIGFGVQADNEAVITDITWDDTKYIFKEPTSAPIIKAPVTQAPAAPATSGLDIYRVHPKSGKITTRSTVSFYVEVTIAGKAAPAGTVVNGYAKGTLVTTGKVNGAGKVKLVVRSKLPKGSSTLKAQLPSSDTVKGSTDSVKVKVVKKK
jgi:hypothetical protein